MKAWGEYPDSTQAVAYGIDLNGDGIKEWFVRANSSLCGFGGCPLDSYRWKRRWGFPDGAQERRIQPVAETQSRVGPF
jgi:hypothetical protein